MKALARIKKTPFLRASVYLLFCVNSVLLIGLVRKYVELRQLKNEQQLTLNNVFPPLSEEQVHGYLKRLFENFETFEEKSFLSHTRYVLYQDNNPIGHAYQVREDIVCPVCEDVRFFVGVDINGAILGVVLVNQFHLYGERMKTENVDEFLSQFIERNLAEAFILGQDIKGITGATKTTKHFLEGILRMRKIHLVEAKQ